MQAYTTDASALQVIDATATSPRPASLNEHTRLPLLSTLAVAFKKCGLVALAPAAIVNATTSTATRNVNALFISLLLSVTRYYPFYGMSSARLYMTPCVSRRMHPMSQYL